MQTQHDQHGFNLGQAVIGAQVTKLLKASARANGKQIMSRRDAEEMVYACAPQRKVLPNCTISFNGITWQVPLFSVGERVKCFLSESGDALYLQCAHEPQRSTWASPVHAHSLPHSDCESGKPASSGSPSKNDVPVNRVSAPRPCESISITIHTSLADSSRNRTRGKCASARRADASAIRVVVEVQSVPCGRNQGSNKSCSA
jgi:hypothetical protein